MEQYVHILSIGKCLCIFGNMYAYESVCVCVCVCVGETDRLTDGQTNRLTEK